MSLKPGSNAARDVAAVLHPMINLGMLEEKGPLMISRAKGVYIWDDQGKQYIEGLAGLWSTALGYGNEELADTAYQQLKDLSFQHMFMGKSHEPGMLLAEKLKEIAPLNASRVFFGCSGSDANDTQVKLMWFYNNALGRPNKKKIIGRVKGYHGITVVAGSLTGLAPMHTGWDLPLDCGRFLHTDFPHHYRHAEKGESEEDFATRCANNLEQMILREGPDTVAAFIAEPVMAAGGVIIPPRTYFEKIQAVCTKYDVIFIADEVVCGFGRTGNAFGSQTFNIKPDSVTFAKALTSSYQPLSAVVINDKIYQACLDGSKKLGTFGHGYTYSGHPVCCAVGLKTIEIYQRDRIFEHAAKMAPKFRARLEGFQDHPLVGEVRSVGLIGAIEFVSNKATKAGFTPAGSVGAYAFDRCHAHGLVARNVGDGVAFCPPLIVNEAQIDEIFDKFALALQDTLDHVTREGLLAA
ncbi:MAG: aminotransferase class III-fold pyridoxal phosphate-dependent enzyme [Gammaproteobacteria bacterium]|nr:aminotransferase class III-fold pyridoxal phosphate-dependent enzyme [Gammaproteobacteria bacterium]